MTHALLAADDPVADAADGLAMAVVPFAPPAVRFSPPVDRSCSAAARPSPRYLRRPRRHARPVAHAAHASRGARGHGGHRAPLRGFNTGLAAAALEICAATPYAPPEALAVIEWLDARLEAICSGLRGALEAEGGGDRLDDETNVARMLDLLWIGRLVSARRGWSLKVGAPHNRLAREILYYQARTPYL